MVLQINDFTDSRILILDSQLLFLPVFKFKNNVRGFLTEILPSLFLL